MSSATTPVWVPLVVAVMGIAGIWLTQHFNKKREDERWNREREVEEVRWNRQKVERLRERRVALYVDLAEYTQRAEATLEQVTDDIGFSHSKPPEGILHPDILTARARLLAPKAVRDAWEAFLTAQDAVIWELYEGDPEYTSTGTPYLAVDDTNVQKERETIATLQSSLRLAMSDPDVAE